MKTASQKVFARAGLLGNPSDGYNGKTISVSIKDFYAEVTLAQSSKLEIIPDKSDALVYPSIEQLASDVALHGYYGGVRLIKATLKRTFEYFRDKGEPLPTPFSIRYTSNIPRQVGFAGSSAIIIATIKAVSNFHGQEIPLRVLPSLALSVEQEELGIPAGLQDRVIQSYGGMVYMDFSDQASETIDGYICGTYEPIEPSDDLNLYVAYLEHAGEPTEVLHNDLRKRFDRGDKDVVSAMESFANLAEQGKAAIESGNYEQLSTLVDQNFDLRKSICNLHPDHENMVQSARACGATAKYCGSGGAIIGTYIDESQFDALNSNLSQIGCKVLKLTQPYQQL